MNEVQAYAQTWSSSNVFHFGTAFPGHGFSKFGSGVAPNHHMFPLYPSGWLSEPLGKLPRRHNHIIQHLK
jgi:hypothetical protein